MLKLLVLTYCLLCYNLVVETKWTGTDADRRDMDKFQLDQVLRVSHCRIPGVLVLTVLAKFWPFDNVWLRVYLTLYLGVCFCVFIL